MTTVLVIANAYTQARALAYRKRLLRPVVFQCCLITHSVKINVIITNDLLCQHYYARNYASIMDGPAPTSYTLSPIYISHARSHTHTLSTRKVGVVPTKSGWGPPPSPGCPRLCSDRTASVRLRRTQPDRGR